jgi:hypothetical protein
MSKEILICHPISYLKKQGLPWHEEQPCSICGTIVGKHKSSPVGLPLVCVSCHTINPEEDRVAITEHQIRELCRVTGNSREMVLKIIKIYIGKDVNIVEDIT